MFGNNYKVKMQATADFRSTMEDIREIQVRNDAGEMVPLSSLGTLRYMVGPRQITRFNKMASADMNAQAAAGVSTQRLYEAIESIELPENFTI